MQKLYCYVDESGQDTKGKLFLVSVVITEKELQEQIEEQLLKVEKESGKRLAKWHGCSFDARVTYLKEVLQISLLKKSIFYATYETAKEYIPLTTYTVAKAIGVKSTGLYEAIIIIDGLNEKERKHVTQGLRQLRVRYKKVRGSRDESSAFLRLADALAGFLRDNQEGKTYAKSIFEKFMAKQMLMKLE